MTKLSSDDKYPPADSLERLLDLDGTIMEMGGGYWAKIEARKVEPTENRPHGIAYSLCMFSPDDVRLICFDNAHPRKLGRGPSKKKTDTGDHVHLGSRVKPYRYTSAEDLMVDFWSEVDKTLKARGIE